ncbi:PREDICTED: pyrethroid hydrolase Ces2a-like [Branchiostoma belcheri]|uniref:Carboxylic ester hydrolase n=1 Tax=Branchiostoma belcheri TaxID=7741 RepID=A0A6P4YFL3_BRABE|nr:PREDICTED: pyrethroid hydrolase Ces2a-like [Branchiostoma belcheri]
MSALPFLLLSLLLVSTSCAAQESEVPTKYGRISGYITDYNGAGVRTFLGVPFAKPPTGELRFMPPEEPEPWDGVREATGYGSACPQESMYLQGFAEPFATVNVPWSEDCLYLNVYAPVRGSSTEDPLAVMVYIHGGGWQAGTGSGNNGTQLATENNVIVVSLNYRLGVFGFLGTGDQHAPGNVGLLDQTQAIRWVRDNIANFGGDVNRITIFGLSAGGMAVSLHLLSPLNSGLFRRAITQSGSPFTPGFLGTKESALADARRLAQSLGCDRTSTEDVVSCLKSKTAQDVLTTSSAVQTPTHISFLPIVDGTFLPTSPEEIFAEGSVEARDYILGVTSMEGGIVLYDDLNEKIVSEETFQEHLEYVMASYNTNLVQITHAAKFEYLRNLTASPRDMQLDFMTMYGDWLFVAPTTRMAREFANTGNPTYLYNFDHITSYLDHPWIGGAAHAEENYYLWPSDNSDMMTDQEKLLGRRMRTMWTNFAKTGNPNSQDLPVTWPQYDQHGRQYLTLSTNMGPGSVQAHLRSKQVFFWNYMVSALARVCCACTGAVSSATAGMSASVWTAVALLVGWTLATRVGMVL